MFNRKSLSRKLIGVAVFGGLSALAAALGARAVREGKGRWSRDLKKPALTPPDRAVPIIGSVFFPLLAISGYRVWMRKGRARKSALALWGAQLALSAAVAPLFFTRRFGGALASSVALLGTMAAYTRKARRVDRLASLLMAPHKAVIAFATYLSAGVILRNRAKLMGKRSS
jgi:tryptophan-rich sensory protein